VTATFRDLGVDGALCDALEAKGITHPFPIQAMTLPMALAGNDLIGQARTGTGKTLAFGLPLLQRIDTSARRTQALIVVPTRELCVQVHEDLTIGSALGIRSIAVYGGTPYEEQTAALESGVHVVVGTPGRLIDHLNRGTLDLADVRALVLDEADEMLDMGFLPDVERLIEACPVDRHTMLFSATMPTAIVRMARRYMVSPTFTRADLTEGETAPNVDQHFMQVHRMDKPRLLARILQAPDRGNVYVFVRTKHMADRLVEDLEGLGCEAIAIHGDLKQATRERNLDRFREGRTGVLVATEVAARGLDVENVSHVVNYDCPEDEKMYLHRIGRTARAGKAGVAITFVEHSEMERANLIRRAIDRTDLVVRETFSTSPELIELFDLPSEVPWARSVGRRRSPEESSGRTDGRGGRSKSGSRDGAGDGGRDGGRDGGKRRGGRGRDTERAPKAPDGQPEQSRQAERKAAPAAAAKPAAGPETREASDPGAGDGTRRRVRTRDRGPRQATERNVSSAEPITRDATGTEGSNGSSRASGSNGSAADAPVKASRGRRGGRGRGGRGRSGDGSGTTSAQPTAETGSAGRSRGRDRGAPREEDRAAPAERSAERSSDRTGDGRSARRTRGGRGGRRDGDGSTGTSTTQPASRDVAARGEGQPQSARRVKVEHLP
jgi:superfamily II DNA/RNA helicase